jgi:hypothetical protein
MQAQVTHHPKNDYSAPAHVHSERNTHCGDKGRSESFGDADTDIKLVGKQKAKEGITRRPEECSDRVERKEAMNRGALSSCQWRRDSIQARHELRHNQYTKSPLVEDAASPFRARVRIARDPAQ